MKQYWDKAKIDFFLNQIHAVVNGGLLWSDDFQL
jgi:hypothetical protein